MPPTRSLPPPRRPAAPAGSGRARPTDADLAGLARLSGLATILGLVLLALLSIGRRVPAPPLTLAATRSTQGWTDWFDRVGPAGATMSAVRVAALALAAYLLVLVVIEVVGRAVGLPRLLSLGRLVSTPLARHLIGGVAGFGLALSIATATVGPAGAASAGSDSASPSAEAQVSDRPVMRALEPADPSSSAAATTMTSLGTDPPVMRALDPAAAPPTASPSPTATTAADQWVIRRGDHLWGVARRTLAGSWHRSPTDAETSRYLDHLIEANLDVLVVPGDADLVLTGQVFRLPPVPAG